MPSGDENQLRAIFERVQPANVRSGDVASYASEFANTATWSPPDAPDQVGPQAIQTALAATLAKVSIDATCTADDAFVTDGNGDDGYVSGWSTQKIQPRDGGQPTVAYTRELWVFKRIGFKWKIVHMVWNLKPGPA